jgi:NAD(P)-dependent dehydrogenase (short-subunit alcohol dehydrogenase family)
LKDRAGGGRETAPVQPNRHRLAVEFSTLVPEHLFDDRYRIVGSLGAGGTGEVFLALDELAGVEVALKVLYPRNEPGHVLDRLRRELEIVRSLDHPGIVQVQHLGEAQGLFYFVMELLQGSSLRARIERDPIPVDHAIEILEALADSLAAAHRSGVVHRDIKPDNVFLATSPQAERERVVLLDFGIAFREGDTRFTSTGDLIGTPHYLAPEQARGQTDIGPAADVYALGALTWEMLSGRPLFQGENAMQVIQAHLSQRVPSAPEFPRETPPWLVRLVKRMLAKQPADRPADGAEVLGMIRRKHGVILNIGSVAGHRLLEVPVHYAAAKAGVSGFSLALAKELSRYGIRVNEVCPGLIEGGIGTNVSERQLAQYKEYCTLGRPGTPKEVAELVAFLASSRASYLNAQRLVIDGGL